MSLYITMCGNWKLFLIVFLALLLFFAFQHIFYRQYYQKKLETFENQLIMIENKKYELDKQSINTILSELKKNLNE